MSAKDIVVKKLKADKYTQHLPLDIGVARLSLTQGHVISYVKMLFQVHSTL